MDVLINNILYSIKSFQERLSDNQLIHSREDVYDILSQSINTIQLLLLDNQNLREEVNSLNQQNEGMIFINNQLKRDKFTELTICKPVSLSLYGKYIEKESIDERKYSDSKIRFNTIDQTSNIYENDYKSQSEKDKFLKKISTSSEIKTFFAGKYGKGSYNNFVYKLKRNMISMEMIDNDLNTILSQRVKEENEVYRNRRSVMKGGSSSSIIEINHLNEEREKNRFKNRPVFKI